MYDFNEGLAEVVQGWIKKGRPNQEGFPWERSKQNWVRLADEFGVDVSGIPDEIDREFLWALNLSEAPTDEVFLAIMIWGYGDVGYGPYRVRQMFQSPDFRSELDKVRALCREDKTKEAYMSLAKSKIRQLGPAFGTKVLTFFHKSQGAPAILDSVVADWFKVQSKYNATVPTFNSEVWNVATFEAYQIWMKQAASNYGETVCTIEQLIFGDQYASAI